MIAESTDSFLRAGLFLCCAAPITFIDLRCSRIPDSYSLGGLACLSLYDAIVAPSCLLGDSLAAVLAFGLFLCVRAMTKGMGFGDLKYAALVAFYLGIPYCFAALSAAAVSATLFFLVASLLGTCGRREKLPFAPFLSAGAIAGAAAKIAAGGWR